MDYPGKVITKTQVTPTQTSASGNWTLDDQAAAIKNNNWPVALVPNPISKSLRFNSADSAYLNRTPASAGNRTTWTWSGWFKRGTLGVAQALFSGGSGGNRTYLFFNSSNGLEFHGNGNIWRVSTNVYRDPAAWYHIVWVLDTNNATAQNRTRIYVNNIEITAWSTNTTISSGATFDINAADLQTIGRNSESGGTSYLNGYLTEINFIDGQALTPSSFGMTNPQTGQWIPLKYSGTYGTNGFYLNFKDATSTTTLGYDYSGNANNWTTNNFSVTAGAGNDSLTDVPTPWFAYNTTGDVGGVIRGNYCTFNPLVGTHSNTYSDGNLQVATSTVNAAFSNQRATFGVSSGKWYWEITCQATNSAFYVIGITADTVNPDTQYVGQGNSYCYRSDTGQKATGGTFSAYGATFTTGDIISVVFDADAGTLVFYKNGATQGTAFTGISGTYFPAVSDLDNNTGRNSTFIANFGQRPFAYTPPTGFRSLCTTNLPATAIGFGLTNQAGKYFNAVTYSGTASAQQYVTVGFQPDLVWIKSRSDAYNHYLTAVYDSFNGSLISNSTAAETGNVLGSPRVDSNGIYPSFYEAGGGAGGSTAGKTFVAWNWKASGSTVSNTAGSITSTVSANTTARFSVVTWTGNGSTGTIGHGLSATPNLIIVKARTQSAARNWKVYSSVLGAGQTLNLNDTAAAGADTTIWNNTSPTSTVFSVGASNSVNENTYTYVAYCFAAVPGYSAFGSYTGNGSADGPFVYTGFRPAFVLHKCSSLAGDGWLLYDTVRQTYNVVGAYLQPNLSNAEGNTTVLDILSNGFKLRSTFSSTNSNGATYIYACFAESPFQFANAR